jgi:peptidoglycan-N-acetylglucosamine deacetylase
LKSLFSAYEWEKKTDKPTVYLTFDDGPHPEITTWVLDILKQFNAKATFFCVGENAQKYPETAQRIRNEGHSIGNHTHNHIKGWNTNDKAYLKNTLYAAHFTSTQLFRPPYGRITRRQGLMLKSKGYRIIMWSLLSCDYLKNLDKNKSLDSLIKNTKSGSIVVFHDSIKAAPNLKWLLPRYIEAMAKKGMTFHSL